MGLLKWFHKKKIEEPVEVPEIENVEELVKTNLEEKKVNLQNKADRNLYVRDNCEQIIETTRQLEESRTEYQIVTAYYSDTQKIDMIPEEPRADIEDAARNIIGLTKERLKFQNTGTVLSNEQYRAMERYEDDIPDEVRNISEKESYNKALKKDMKYLEAEKKMLLYERDEKEDRQAFYKQLSMFIMFLTVMTFLALGISSIILKTDLTIPFIMTVAFVLVLMVLVLVKVRNNQKEAVLTERKLSKAIGLLNKVKIKYINNQCSLDYSYQKFMIQSAADLTETWEKYRKLKEATNKYKENTELLNFYNESLVKQLRSYQVRDAEVWLHQPEAIIDDKEMVEIKHKLNVRRQKLRDRMEYNTRTKEESLENIRKVIAEDPMAAQEIQEALRKFKIEL